MAQAVGTKTRKRAKPRRSKAQSTQAEVEHRMLREVLAVFLCCAGLLSLLALLSYRAEDVSLNAASSHGEIHNWIGPAGAYIADLLLQALGVGAYALGVGSLLAGCRSVAGRRVLPGLREALGLVLLIAFSGAFAELWIAEPAGFPAGGIGGALLATTLERYFAPLGAAIIGGALVLVALAITADGMLRGLGLQGLRLTRDVMSRICAAVVKLRQKRRHLRQLRAERRAESAVRPTRWAFAAPEDGDAKVARQKRLDRAKSEGEALAAEQVQREVESGRLWRTSRPVDRSEPELVLDQKIDLEGEEELEPGYELGELAAAQGERSDSTLQCENPPAPPTPDRGELEEVSIRAADPWSRDPRTEADPGGPTSDDDQRSHGRVQRSGRGPAEDHVALPRVERTDKSSGEPEIVDVRPPIDSAKLVDADEVVAEERSAFELPTTALLDFEAEERVPIEPMKLRENAQKLVRTLKEYKINGAIREIRPGPVVTMYEFVPAPGIKISRIAGLADDIAMSMAAMRVRIVAPIPGKGAVGIEIPNDTIETVFYKEIISDDTFKKAKSRLTIALGKDIEGKPVVANLAKMPHLLVAGATGAGKSVSVNAMIMSILFKATPSEVRFIMVDPKMLELSVYNGIPHLMLPVVTDPKKASLALRWAVEEMERRYKLLSDAGVKNIDGFNAKIGSHEERGEVFSLPPERDGEPERQCERMPYIVVVVDELADLMMVASREVESSIMRMAQMARAAGIHLILATQRPSVDVITGSIKANLPTRIAFRVAQKNDSRTILDQNGAQSLLGRGDMLFMANGAAGLQRVHGAFVNEEEVERTVAFIKAQGKPCYDETILQPRGESDNPAAGADEDRDEMYDHAVAIVTESRQASISMIQRKLKIGYNRAARMVETMESEGIVGPPDGSKPRAVLAPAPPAL